MSNTKTGFKQTEVGLIPSDWDVKTLGEIGTFKNGINKSSEDFGFGFPFVNLMDVFGKSSISENESFGLINSNEIERKLYDLKKGDVLFIRSSVKPSGVGLTCVLENNLPDIVYSGFIIRYRDNNYLSVGFKKHCFYEERFRNNLIASSTVSANTNINQEALKKLLIPLPPTKAEQTAIATALSDADALISSLEKLIAKKRMIKQGAMQKLFATGNLQELKLDDIVVIKKGEQLNKSDMSEKGTYPALNGGIEPSGYTDKWNTEKDTITISEGGNSCGFVNFSTERFWLGGHCYSIELIDSKFPKVYLYQHLKFRQNQIMELRVGSGLPNIQKTALNNFKMKIHKSHDEKIKVANCLNDMDAEINALETKMEKYKKVKLGMMQNLLTGRIRLI